LDLNIRFSSIFLFDKKQKNYKLINIILIYKNMIFHKTHTNFLEYLEVIKNKSQNTIIQYDRHLNKFYEYLEDKNIDSNIFEVESITLDLAE